MIARQIRALTQRQEKFCHAYLIEPDATKAAVAAGYSPGVARIQASQMLRLPWIKERIEVLQRPMKRETLATRERVIEELSRIAFADIREIYDEHGRLKPIHELEAHVAATISEVNEETRTEGRGDDAETVRTKKVRTYDKMRALEMLAKHLSLFTDAVAPVVNITNNTQNNVAIGIGDLRSLSEHERSLVRQLAEARSLAAEASTGDAGPDQG